MSEATGLRFGAIVRDGGVLFQVWTQSSDVELILEARPPITDFHLRDDGVREVFVAGLRAGARYGYKLDGAGPFPDPASRFQPDGVHALSEVIDPAFAWSDHFFEAPPWKESVIYELHCGTFTPTGTFRAAMEKLPLLKNLGVSAIELMPIADFPGRWNWGYDGVSLYAPSRNYGRPEDLRAFVNHAHELGLAVYLDVVYNHFGPDGAYHRLFHPDFYAPDVQTPWGEGLNYKGPVRQFFIENALYWIAEYHIDGFRLDATHAIEDESDPHFLAEFTEAVDSRAVVIAEDSRNLASLLRSDGLDAVWADDFHHQVRRALAGDRAGYYSDYDGSPASIARTLRNGWFYEGQHSQYRGHSRGTPTEDLERNRFVICIQNHDQIGNRAHGERLNHQVSAESYRAASGLLLLAPETPLLFMGQEWAASSPFQYFTDHHEQLGQLVTEGRRREFSDFPDFARAAIPDPQAESTFFRSQLKWMEREQPVHAEMLRWYTRLIELRKRILLEERDWKIREENGIIIIEWRAADSVIAVAVALSGRGRIAFPESEMRILFSSEDPEFTDEQQPPLLDRETHWLEFQRAGCAALVGGPAR